MSVLSDVTDCLMNYADMEAYTAEQLQPYCDAALSQVRINLKPGISDENPLVIPTAAAIAHFNFFLARLSETDKYEAYTAGDMTVRRNLQKEFIFEERIKNEALAAASSILRDMGFAFRGE